MGFSAGSTADPLTSGWLKDAIGYGNMNIVVAALCLTSALLSFVYIGGRPDILQRGGSQTFCDLKNTFSPKGMFKATGLQPRRRT